MLFVPIKFKTFVQLAPYEIGTTDYDKLIEKKLRTTYEGVCTRYGYLRPNSIEVTKRSMGLCMKHHFNGYFRFEVHCKGEVCNPAKHAVVKAVVRNKNALGLHAESLLDDGTPVLDIIVPKRSAGIVSTIDLERVNIGDSVYVEILGKQCQLNDRKISIIGRCVVEPTTEYPASLPDLEEAQSVEEAVAEEGAIDEEELFMDDLEEDDESDAEDAKVVTVKGAVVGGEDDDGEVESDVCEDDDDECEDDEDDEDNDDEEEAGGGWDD